MSFCLTGVSYISSDLISVNKAHFGYINESCIPGLAMMVGGFRRGIMNCQEKLICKKKLPCSAIYDPWAPGIDGMDLKSLRPYLIKNWLRIKERATSTIHATLVIGLHEVLPLFAGVVF
jgi:hypothetical protein